jgi:hypothetical protein
VIADRDNGPDVEVFAQAVRGTLDDLAQSLPVPETPGAVGQPVFAQSVGEAAIAGDK